AAIIAICTKAQTLAAETRSRVMSCASSILGINSGNATLNGAEPCSSGAHRLAPLRSQFLTSTRLSASSYARCSGTKVSGRMIELPETKGTTDSALRSDGLRLRQVVPTARGDLGAPCQLVELQEGTGSSTSATRAAWSEIASCWEPAS